MPETPNLKLRQPPSPPEAPANPAPSLPYAELDVTTNFSFLRGASHPDELVYRAMEQGYRAIGVTDVNSVAGVVRAHEAAKQVDLKLVIGSRLTLADGPDMLVWPTDRAAYARLCRLLTVGKRRAEKGKCLLYLKDLVEYQEGLVVAICESREESDEATKRRSDEGEEGEIRVDVLRTLREVFADRLSLATSCSYIGDDESRLRRVATIARRFHIPLLATNHVHYHDSARRALQDVLTCIRHGCTIQQAGFKLFPNAERYLKSPEQMHRLFAAYPQAIRRGLEIAERCTFNLDELRYEYPDEVVPEGYTPLQYLAHLAWTGAATRYPEGVPDKVRELIAHELVLIEQLKFEPYFLTVYDIVRFARSRGILCQGRGSAANSAVCYCIGVTSVDPARIDVLFERFISSARNEPPDIDIDFEHERREEVLQYLYEKYGRERAGMTAEVITYRGRSAVRDVGKALGLGLDTVDQMARRLDWWHRGSLTNEQIIEAGLDPADRTVRTVTQLTGQLLGFPRHLSQHVGGMVMTRGPLCEMVPIENASMADRTVIEWDKDDIDAVGILKVDVLGLGMLSCISRAFRMVEGGRSDEGEEGNAQEEIDYGDGENVSGFDCLAARDGLGESGVCGDEENAGFGTVRIDQPSKASSGVGTIQHCRRSCETESSRLPEISENRAWVAGRGGDSDGTGLESELHSSKRATLILDRGSRSNPSSLDSRSGTKNELTQPLSPRPPLCRSVAVAGSRQFRSLSSLRRSPRLELHTIPPEDALVYDMICNADTIGVFQIESRAQMSMLPRLRPRCFYDLVIEVAIVRPGPIQGNMVHPYLKRRNGEEQVSYPSKALEQVLSKTLGVPLFQEQAMKVAMVGAGFSAGEADQLRRAMAAWRKNGAIEKFYPKIINGMLANGYTREFAEQCFLQIRGFGEYGFPESHSASFALLVYVSAWLKCHHPAAFCAALINSQPMGFYAPAQIVRDAKDHGVEVRRVDVGVSEWDCFLEEGKEATERRKGAELATARDRDGATKGNAQSANSNSSDSPCHLVTLSPCLPSSPFVASSLRRSVASAPSPSVRLGFRIIKGFQEAHAQRIVDARAKHGPFTSVEQFRRVTRLPVHAIRRLAEADAFDSLGHSRRSALWETMALSDEQAPLFEETGDDAMTTTSTTAAPTPVDEAVDLPKMPMGQEVMTDYSTTGFSLKQHPLQLLRSQLTKKKIITAQELNQRPAGTWVKVAGLVLIRQRPGTASGIVFETLEDETGIVNLIIRPNIYEQYRPAARHAILAQADGYVERQGQVIHVMVKRMFDLSEMLEGYRVRSRDFH